MAIELHLATGAAATIALGGAFFGRHLIASRLRAARDEHGNRPALWNRFYEVDWGDTTTNNYGYAPAEEDHPQRFQREMYRQLLHRLDALRGPSEQFKLLEVSCGRAGGLEAFLEAGGERFDATGLDVAQSAIDWCRAHYSRPALRFVQGSALELPFEDDSFDVILNVEASNDYGDRPRFLAEVARVLKDDGVFLYADTCWEAKLAQREAEFRAAGFSARFDDITANVAEACRRDSPRRRDVIGRHAPLLVRIALRPQLENYAAVEGTRKYDAFAAGKRRYLMTAATKSA
jgi:SAM-dependent methyltransferase